MKNCDRTFFDLASPVYQKTRYIVHRTRRLLRRQENKSNAARRRKRSLAEKEETKFIVRKRNRHISVVPEDAIKNDSDDDDGPMLFCLFGDPKNVKFLKPEENTAPAVSNKVKEEGFQQSAEMESNDECQVVSEVILPNFLTLHDKL
ncbi:unnamed protein product [Gongylonema pulchrum]|uniref:B3 domain-containing protein n=1 Tax=Gongylonema pulchrum TaxID=637853 RepID=A0A183ELW6_9BILA|nr:unnamed protein product [Gongylonema pulchrum]